MPTTLLISLIIVIAFGGEALFGFGGGLVAVPLLSLFLDVHDVVVLVAIFQFLLGFLVLKNFREVAWSLLPPLLVGMVLGVLMGVKILPIVSEQLLRVLLAAYILAFLVKTKLAPELAVTRASWAGGIFSGGSFRISPGLPWYRWPSDGDILKRNSLRCPSVSGLGHILFVDS
jgi:uncharacterized membrane protein YfcA